MRAALLALLSATLLAVAGCSTGTGAVARGGSFEFVSPGGRTDIFYDPPADRGAVGDLAGESLLEPGTTISLEEYRGQVVVLNVWGSWCGPCRAEADDLQRVADTGGSPGGDAVAVLGIDVRDSRSAAVDFVRNYQLSYPSIYDPPGRSLFALRGVPRSVVPLTVVLDRQHRVAAVFLRPVLASDLLPVVRRVGADT
ncbi:MAG TPA: TlpA disulfide reductase family protein [Pseudonocardiaceae bacterium]|jgi:thiol-disulfide isomerase/thioredoxin|nr:TlpA disulfide reductase family protein [Pseudonocardiaceae bacterium]